MIRFVAGFVVGAGVFWGVSHLRDYLAVSQHAEQVDTVGLKLATSEWSERTSLALCLTTEPTNLITLDAQGDRWSFLAWSDKGTHACYMWFNNGFAIAAAEATMVYPEYPLARFHWHFRESSSMQGFTKAFATSPTRMTADDLGCQEDLSQAVELLNDGTWTTGAHMTEVRAFYDYVVPPVCYGGRDFVDPTTGVHWATVRCTVVGGDNATIWFRDGFAFAAEATTSTGTVSFFSNDTHMELFNEAMAQLRKRMP